MYRIEHYEMSVCTIVSANHTMCSSFGWFPINFSQFRSFYSRYLIFNYSINSTWRSFFTSVCLFTVCAYTAADHHCPNNFHLVDGKCYMIGSSSLTFNDAVVSFIKRTCITIFYQRYKVLVINILLLYWVKTLFHFIWKILNLLVFTLNIFCKFIYRAIVKVTVQNSLRTCLMETLELLHNGVYVILIHLNHMYMVYKSHFNLIVFVSFIY